MSKKRRNKVKKGLFDAKVMALSHEGRGIARVEGKTTFIDASLPDELVKFTYTRSRPKFDEGVVEEVIEPSSKREEPKCEFFGYCGGCSLQHMKADFQLEHKQNVLLEQFEHIGSVKPEIILPVLTGSLWGYRHKARLAVKYVTKKTRVLVGFREKRSSFVADIDHCEILHPSVGNKIQILQNFIEKLSIKDAIPQIEVAVSDDAVALVLRHIHDFTATDNKHLKEFEKEYNFKIFLQPGGYDTIHRLNKEGNEKIFYTLPEYGLKLYFYPTDFTQINAYINREMITKAIELLDIKANEVVLDLFCGIGNFTLPIAKKAKYVVGVEGSKELVSRAKYNADKNNISNAGFYMADLFKEEVNYDFMQLGYDKLLLDPPRTGAKEIIELLDLKSIKRIVYISCNISTLARDANILVNVKGFKLKKAGVIDMFPHTTHFESIAVFENMACDK